MNSRQRRKRRRFALAFRAEGRTAAVEALRRRLNIHRTFADSPDVSTADVIVRAVESLKRARNAAEGRATARQQISDELERDLTRAKLEITKLTNSLKRQSPLVAELQIALRHAVAATSIFGKDPGHMAVATVESVNAMRKRILAATGNADTPQAPTDVIEVKLLE